jgi:hypothetical protein
MDFFRKYGGVKRSSKKQNCENAKTIKKLRQRLQKRSGQFIELFLEAFIVGEFEGFNSMWFQSISCPNTFHI